MKFEKWGDEMRKIVGRVLAVCVLASFCAMIAPESVSEARPHRSSHKREYDKRDAKRYDRRHDNRRDYYGSRGHLWPEHRRVIIDTVSIRDRHYDYARRNGFALNDLLVARAIADRSGFADTEDVLRMMRRGHDQRWVAHYYGVSWRDVERQTGNSYNDLKRNLVKAGIMVWALDRLLD